ncbi:MAG: dihydroxyacetone kinase subunit L [Planctomycetaceae bacterium]|jgi:dihydroxyacetone kinase-like protein|nr:dihydroxyacetone kinase subunit L [Planctomycetaceae bacterium]
MKFTKLLFCQMLETALEWLEKHLPMLNQLDAAIGDGDHGTAILAAMKAAVSSAQTSIEKNETFSTTLENIGFNVMSATNGSTSTLSGLFFTGMAGGITSEELNADETIIAFENGLANVQTMTKAQIGDKTLMDALIPAIEAMSRLKGTNASFTEIFLAARDAAKNGAASTKELIAKYGRAKNLGERSCGHLDAGAVSTELTYAAYAYIVENAEKNS